METRAMLEEFRALVRAGILRVTPENEVLPVKAQAIGGEKDTPVSREQDVALLDKQLMEWMERRRAQKAAEARRAGTAKAAEPEPDAPSTGIRESVIERVAQKLLETWDKTDQTSDSRQSLREQVVERIAEEILRRWQRNPE